MLTAMICSTGYIRIQQIENLLIKKFGIAWYNKSGTAVNFIIENEYAHIERSSLPAFDMEQYKKDVESGDFILNIIMVIK